MELTDALGSISEIRAQLARTETFRGFRSLTVGCSGLLGVGAALHQVMARGYTGLTVSRPVVAETTALGAAYAAGGQGVIPSDHNMIRATVELP